MMTATSPAIAPVWNWQQHRFRAMNSAIFAQFYAPAGRSPARAVEELFRYFEQLLSRFRPSSELSLLNRHDRPDFAAGADLFAAVEAALWAAQQTGGIYDPTILPYLEAAGYDRTFAALADRRPLAMTDLMNGENRPVGEPLPLPLGGLDYRHVALERFTRLIHRPVGLQIDLGGMGKGWTVDRCVDELRDAGYFLINAGGDLFAYGAPPGEQGWQVHLAHAFDPQLKIATLAVAHRAVATSTIGRRRWFHDGRVQHHLIDPRTGCPAVSDLVSVSVVGERVFTAEVYAKSALILGREAGLKFLESLGEIEGLLVTTTGEVVQTSGIGRYVQRLDPMGY